MIGKVKKWLGIEGVKLELIIPEEISKNDGVVSGKIRLLSLNDQTLTHLKVVMIEKYSRGRKKEKLVDEYQIGFIEIKKRITVVANQPKEIAFDLPFNLVKSEVENFGEQNFLFKGLTKLASLAYSVQSDFYILSEAIVEGVALNPFDKKVIRLK